MKEGHVAKDQNKSRLLSSVIERMPVFLFVVFLLLQSIQSMSQENQSPKTQELYDLSIEELLNIKVITASRYEQSITDAPGIISVITAKEIEQFGAMNLFEVLNRVPNVISSIGLALDVVTIRGGDFNAWTGRIAYLINGYPIRNVGGNGTYYNLFYALPINSIKQIEIIRGPGSVLYGTSAFDGVINIITKDETNENLTLNTTLGQYNTSIIDLSFGAKKEDLKYFFNGHFSQTNGAPLYSEGSEGETSRSFELFMPQKNVSFISNVTYKNIKINFLTARSEKFSNHLFDEDYTLLYTEPGPLYSQIHYTTEFFQFSIEHEFEISKSIDLKNTIGVNDETFQWIEDRYTTVKTRGIDYFFESLLKYSISEKTFILSGFNYRKLTSKKSTIFPKYNFDYIAFFAELKYLPFDNLQFYFGAQYNQPINYKGAFVPRLSILYKINDEFSIEYSLAQAFRSPDPPQYLYDNRVLAPDGSVTYYDKGNPNLKPEIITTHDLQLTYKIEKLTLQLAAYYSKGQDLIKTSPKDVDIGDEIVTYLFFRDNLDFNTRYGFELESKFSLNEFLYTTASFVYNQNKHLGEIKNYTLAPNYQFKIGVSLSQPTYSIAAFLIASGAYHQIEGNRNTADNMTFINPAPNKFYDLSAKFQLYISRLFPTLLIPKTIFSIYGRNLLDYKHWQPDHFSYRINTLPGMPGRNINFQLSIKF